MKNLLTTLLLILTLLCVCTYYTEIMQFIMINFVYHDDILVKEANEYEKQIDWEFVQETDNFYPENRQDILNIFYTALNKGWDELIFYCPTDYENCSADVNEIALDSNILSYVNNYVSTYNSYHKIYVSINNFGRVRIQINKIYNEEMISAINTKIDQIYNDLINDSMTDEEKIRVIHDYIANNTRYDEERANQIQSGFSTDEIHASNTAYGPLFNGKAICGGYTDIMALFLDKMGLKNFKVASSRHIWNVVYLDGEWRHLDLTWDDPVTDTKEDIITYDYYLITTEELKLLNVDDSRHSYNEKIFMELKEN